MSQTETDDLAAFAEKFMQFLTEYGISQTRAGKSVGYSKTTMSNFLRGKYDGDNKKARAVLEQYMADEIQLRSRKTIGICNTVPRKQVFAVLDEIARTRKDIAIITGLAGLGKTTAVTNWCTGTDDAIYIKVNEMHRNVFSLTKTLGRALGVRVNQKSGEIINDIVGILRRSRFTIVIDEANYLTPRGLELLRQVIFDDGQTPIALVGLPVLEYQIKSLKNDHQQLVSRIGVSLALQPLLKKDCELMVKTVWPDAGAEVINEIYAWSVEPYAGGDYRSTRRLSKLVDKIQFCMGTSGGELDKTLVAEAASLLFDAKREAV
jgi:DNA transposition AAA+ family ATPase